MQTLCFRKLAKSECDWLVMSSVFVASQSSCFFLCSREQIGLVENRLNTFNSEHVHTDKSAMKILSAETDTYYKH